MEFYSTWVYRNIFNAEWALWTFVVMIMTLNILAPIFVWMIMNGTPVTNLLKKRMKNKKEENMNN
ncbi:hypothetical protein [Robertmurraya korlensis]|uniref:hypothetical protein n=1 Tax=Robertmurraya korlensis TaxID=519977 RepID=UPI000826A9A2|nr:hypothetical protein [Robertmurraya korlensis]